MRRTLYLIALIALAAWGSALAQSARDHSQAERRWAQRNAIIAREWRIVFWGQVLPCVPVSNIVQGARNPDEALATIQERDPDAYIVHDPKAFPWEKIIRTQGHSMRMVSKPFYCVVWRSLYLGY